ncbi:hypothetical protein ACJX0J_018990, partial [Zea mays]
AFSNSSICSLFIRVRFLLLGCLSSYILLSPIPSSWRPFSFVSFGVLKLSMPVDAGSGFILLFLMEPAVLNRERVALDKKNRMPV